MGGERKQEARGQEATRSALALSRSLQLPPLALHMRQKIGAKIGAKIHPVALASPPCRPVHMHPTSAWAALHLLTLKFH
jgi:hypothetical protein